jgi:hypothetical protein
MRAFARRFLPGVVLLAATACDDPPGPGAGVLTATLVSPNGAEGAAHVTLYGPGLGTVGALGARTFSHAFADTLNVVLVLDQPGELRFTVAVADTTRRPSAVVVEVAGGDNQLRADPHRYRLELRP